MKPLLHQKFSLRKTGPLYRKEGMALVIVLSVLVLLTILVVGFLSRATLDRTSASAYSDGSRNSQLADYAANIVQAQIDHAATRTNTAWASQPGMVRTFTSTGSLLQAYKLYSDGDMVTNLVDLAAATTALANWSASPAHFVDLNEPVTIEGINHYPIIDPSAIPPPSPGVPKIEGFEVTNAPNTTARQPIPLPVRWLYLLRDGQLVAPSNTSGDTATITGATTANPIVGRIAFWTDDETCKLNINTAAHGTFWDIPRAFTLDERDRMARFQPALREYQRYPGHPASTSLWPVLGYKVTDPKLFGSFIYNITPRVQQGGSEGGTKFTGAFPVTLDTDRLYVSIDELLFSGTRAAQAGLDRSDIERAKFFLTARSNSPEVNLFNLPRMAIWPINAGTKTPSTLDKLIARCATINGKPYFFQRSDSTSATADMLLDNSRNQKLYVYINALLAKPFPGFGTTSFATKYTTGTTAETPQITTSIFDYIRSSNLYSTALGSTPYTGTGANPLTTAASGAGQVTPLVIGSNKGFGRLPTISQAVFHLYVSGMSSLSGSSQFPSATYPMQTGSAPRYSDGMAAGSSGAIRNFLNVIGVGNQVRLLTSGIIYFDTFDPMLGYTMPRYNYDIDVSFSGGWMINGQPLVFPSNTTLPIRRDQILAELYNSKTNSWGATYFGRTYGGQLGPLWMMQNFTSVSGNGGNPIGGNAYPLASQRIGIHLPVTLVDENAGTPPAKPTLPSSSTISDAVNFSGGTVTATLKAGGVTIQTYTFTFPPYTKLAPIYAPVGYLPNRIGGTTTNSDIVIKQFATSADFRNRWANQPLQNQKFVGSLTAPTDYCDLSLIQGMDTVVALEPAYGDKRILAARSSLVSGLSTDPNANFVPNKDYDSTPLRVAADLRTDSFGTERKRWATGSQTPAESRSAPGRILDLVYGQNAMPDIPTRYPNGIRTTTQGIPVGTTFWPDFDNGTLHYPDDAYVNRADEGSGNDFILDNVLGMSTGNRSYPWYNDTSSTTAISSNFDNSRFYSPNKQMPSAGMFGSLPTGVVRNRPWQTLLFRPDPGNHPGAQSPEDFLLLDLFWMPVVEPYAISEPFSTNGKVNMNYQIMPFGGYLHRSTALQGVLQTQELVTLSNSDSYTGGINPPFARSSGDQYKKYDTGSGATGALYSTISIRRKLNLSKTDGTLKAFEDLFSQNQIFRSETQICSLPLIPSDATWSANFESSYWDSRRLTGDNSREMPYTQLLPRLTTRSNTYTVHFRVQTLKKSPVGDAGVWTESRDKVTAELRGSRTIERYLDPNDTRIPDYGSDPSATPSLNAFYRWRTLYNKTFAP